MLVAVKSSIACAVRRMCASAIAADAGEAKIVASGLRSLCCWLSAHSRYHNADTDCMFSTRVAGASSFMIVDAILRENQCSRRCLQRIVELQ